VADALVVLEHRDARMLGDEADQTFAAARDDQIDFLIEPQKLGDALVAAAIDDRHGIDRQPRLVQRRPQHIAEHPVAVGRVRPTAQDHRVTRLEAQGRRVRRDADPQLAVDLALNGKVQRPGVCNAVETILFHEDCAPELLPLVCRELADHGVRIRGDARTRQLYPPAEAATEADWPAEYLDLIVAVRVVPDLDEAIAHIRKYGSNHTEAIVTEHYESAMKFLRRVGAATVLINASTRFADGQQLGLGAEIGISTTKLHAYGPMGLEGLTTQKFIVFGDGQVRE